MRRTLDVRILAPLLIASLAGTAYGLHIGDTVGLTGHSVSARWEHPLHNVGVKDVGAIDISFEFTPYYGSSGLPFPLPGFSYTLPTISWEMGNYSRGVNYSSNYTGMFDITAETAADYGLDWGIVNQWLNASSRVIALDPLRRWSGKSEISLSTECTKCFYPDSPKQGIIGGANYANVQVADRLEVRWQLTEQPDWNQRWRNITDLWVSGVVYGAATIPEPSAGALMLVGLSLLSCRRHHTPHCRK